MGQYLNPDNEKFKQAIASQIYVDKTELIKYTNSVICTLNKYICVSRPRRFGKSIAAGMLEAYYSKGCDSNDMFIQFKLGQSKDFEKHLNKYIVITLNIQEFLTNSKSMDEMLLLLKKRVLWELLEEYPDFRYFDETNLTWTMQDIYKYTKSSFIVIIDEWDCIFREYKNDRQSQEQYLDFLRDFLKDKVYISLAYMTGILPIKKYGTHSALNMFTEFSMTNPKQLAEFVGFTQSEVHELCERFGRNEEEMKEWYNGYYFAGTGAIYNPKAVVETVLTGIYDTYWNQTETFEALKAYIDMNFDGLKDSVIAMLAGDRVQIDIRSFANDMVTMNNYEDVLTLLIHLGYLAYDWEKEEVFIPNKEISKEYVTAIRNTSWGEVIKSVKKSEELLNHLWNCEENEVASGIERTHLETSYLQYNDENALSYTISLALYAARNYYTIIRELPSGKGFADMVFVPKPKHKDKPALVVELKWDKSANGAINQILEKQYCESLKDYVGKIFLVGINYDKKTKVHKCIIEEYEKI